MSPGGLDSVSLQSASSSGSGQHTNVEEKGLLNDGNVVTKGLNGEVRSLADSSGVSSCTETPNDKVCTKYLWRYICVCSTCYIVKILCFYIGS